MTIELITDPGWLAGFLGFLAIAGVILVVLLVVTLTTAALALRKAAGGASARVPARDAVHEG